MKRRAISIFLLTLAFLGLNPLNTNAAETTTVQLDLSENTLQFGGFPGVRDEEKLLNGIYLDEITDDACMTVSDKEDALESIRALVDRSIDTQADTIDVSEYGLSEDAAVGIVSDVLNANPSYFFVEGASAVMTEAGTVDSIELAYAETADERRQEYSNAVDEIISQIDPDWNDEEKIFFLHDYLVTHCQYDIDTWKGNNSGNVGYTAYGALVLHLAVCQGYAEAFEDLCREARIGVNLVSSETLNHAWNIVDLNGKRYYVDCTWDDPIGYGEDCHMFDYYCDHKNLLCSQDEMVQIGHIGSDWTYIDDSGMAIMCDGLYQDKTFDDAEWKSLYCTSPVVIDDDGIICHNKQGKSGENYYGIYRYRCGGCALEEIKDLPLYIYKNRIGGEDWFFWEGLSIVKCGDSVFYNDGDTIYSLDIRNNSSSPVYSLSDSEKNKGYIYGMQASGSKIKYDIGTGRWDKDKTSEGVLDVSCFIKNYVEIDKKSIHFTGLGGKENLTAESIPVGNVEWTSLDMSVATVSDGVVTAAGYGKTIIIASTNGVKSFCLVSVDTTWQNEYVYYTVERTEMNIIKYKGTDDNIIIPGSATINGETYSVKGIYIDSDKVKGISIVGPIKLDKLGLHKCTNLKEVSLRNVDTSSMESMYSMFDGCSSLQSLDLSSFNTDNVKDMNSMFYGCSSLQSLDLSSFNTNNVKNMDYMFYGCSSLQTLDLSSFNTDNVESINSMFYGCSSLQSLDLSSFNTDNVKSMDRMFYRCSSLQSLDLSGFNTGNVKNMDYMFFGCSSFKSLDLSKFDFSNVTSAEKFLGHGNYLLDKFSLNKIHTPRNVSLEIKLPGEFEDSNREKYTLLPQNKSESMVLTRNIPPKSLRIGDEDKDYIISVEMFTGTEKKLKVSVTPKEADDKSVVWTSSDPSLVSVTEDGTIKALKSTTDPVTITATSAADSTVSSSVSVKVYSDISSVLFDPISGIDLLIGQTRQLKYETFPKGGTVTSESWSSVNTNVATVDQKGIVTAVGEGSTTIFLTVNGKHTGFTFVTVTDKVIPLESFELGTTALELNTGEEIALSVNKVPEDATEKLGFTSSDTKVATVDDTGLVRAVCGGQADITVSGAGIKKNCHVTVYDRLTGVSLDLKKATVKIDDTLSIHAGIEPEGIVSQVSWSSDDGGRIIELKPSKDGMSADITAKDKGRVVITVSANDFTREPYITKETSAVITVLDKGSVELENGFVISGLQPSYNYAGTAVCPDIQVYYDGIRLVERKEFTVSFAKNKGPGTGYLYVTGKGSFTGKSQSVPFEITAAKTGDISIKKAKISGIEKSYPFNGMPVTIPGLKVELNGTELKEGEDYIVSYRNHTDSGTGSIVIQGIGDKKGTITKKFKITPVKITDTAIEELSTGYKAGGARPVPRIVYGDYELKYGVDYKVSWKGSRPGTGTMTITGTGNFTGTTTKTFGIETSDLSNTTIAVTDVKYKNNAKATYYMSKVKIYDTDGKALKAGRDYTLKYEDVTQNIELDAATGKNVVARDDVIRVTASTGSGGNYTGIVSTEYIVTDSVLPITKETLKKIPAQQYCGEEIEPQICFTKLEENKDFEVIWYANNIRKGTGKALVKGTGSYSGCRIVTFKIAARKL